MSYFKAKMHQILTGAAPRPQTGFEGILLLTEGREWDGRKGKEMEGKEGWEKIASWLLGGWMPLVTGAVDLFADNVR